MLERVKVWTFRTIFWALSLAPYLLLTSGACGSQIRNKISASMQKRPNILFIISDDQSYPHTSAYGAKFVNTPNFDRIAHNGILFTNAFVAAPQCSPSRASILTGQYIWQLGPAGTHASIFPVGLTVYTDILKQHGYAVGYTGKGWAPGSWEAGGRKTNPAGKLYDDKNKRYTKIYPEKRYAKGISKTNYAASFKKFLSEKDKDAPFCFWFGGHEPHRSYEKESGLKRDKSLDSVYVPDYLPDAKVIKSDMLDYAVEIEWFDMQVGRVLDALKQRDELKNTLVIYTSDNGMSFPRAKALCFDAGTHVPLAIMWQNGPIIKPGRTVDDLISLVDIFPTILQAAGLKSKTDCQGKSLFNIFTDGKSGVTDSSRMYIYWGRERHSNSRWDNFGYPQRAIRSHKYLFIWNLKPKRYPAGFPKKFDKNDSLVWAYQDIDASPSKSYMIEQHVARRKGKGEKKENTNTYQLSVSQNLPYFKMAFDKFPEKMLYNIRKDPYCLHNLADNPKYRKVEQRLFLILKQKLKLDKDPRLGKTPNVWNSYRRYGPMRRFPKPNWAK